MATEFVTMRDGSGQSRHLLPPGENSQLDHEASTYNVGSFLFVARPDGVLSYEQRMPTDEVTGLPYTILPVDLSYAHDLDEHVNYHHHFYNRRHPDLEGNYELTGHQLANPEDIPFPIIAGLAVRISRGQRLPIGLHQLAHRRYPIGPALPHNIDEKFTTAVKACSGIVSRWALDLRSNDGDRLVYMDDDLFERVASPKLLCTERVYYDKPANHRRRILGNFFLRYAANQNMQEVVSQKVIQEFLKPRDDIHRRAVGNFILREAMEARLEPLRPMYREMKKLGLVQPGRPDVRTAIWKYIHPERRERVFRVLHKRLAEVA